MNKKAKKIGCIGQWIMVLGAILYVAELFTIESLIMTYTILGIFLVSIVMQIIGWAGTKEERRANQTKNPTARIWLPRDFYMPVGSSILFAGEDSVGEYGSADQIGGIDFQRVRNVEKHFQ